VRRASVPAVAYQKEGSLGVGRVDEFHDLAWQVSGGLMGGERREGRMM
jgi:hypothetical protein